MDRVPVVMTVAGSDSGGGAGIQADLKTFAALGVYGTTAITAITAQNTLGVTAVFELPPDMVAAQIDALVEDMGADAVKTGMLASAPIVEAVADRLRHHGLGNVVVDPVMVAKSGHPLLLPDAVDALRRLLLPLATVVTPNLPEAEALVGRPLPEAEGLEEAARQIAAMGPQAVVIKGGHLPGEEVTDLLYWRGQFYRFASPRVATANTHGTGCTFASAIAAYLAKGLEVPEAVARAKDYLTQALRHAYPIGRGRGPVHHFWQWWR
ncbi:MAG TPA: bifunctional hydroxymethylpyrimidine kinase/phosphomethylpyrimidine kinase [Dehalococcoidia bacterium]|nr:bifunctional hydroxymethylpyrimidine kinase/phosphomethylpyrimidine kinase [Dehalococcoidia bacterium]